jgi:hypothetical protein
MGRKEREVREKRGMKVKEMKVEMKGKRKFDCLKLQVDLC